MRFVNNEQNADDFDRSGNGTLREFAAALKEEAQRMRIPVIDSFSELCISPYNKEYYYQVEDGVHFNVRGRRMYAALISGYIDLYCADLLSGRIPDFEGN